MPTRDLLAPIVMLTLVLVACGDDKSSVKDTCDDTQDACPNGAPTLSPIPEQRIVINRTWTYAAEASDPDNDPLTFTLTTSASSPSDDAVPDGLTVDETGTLSFTPDTLGTFELTLTVSDPGGLSASQPLRLVVIELPPDNRPPAIAPVANQTITAGETLTLTFAAGDPDGDPLTFTVTPERTDLTPVTVTGPTLTWSPTRADRGTNLMTVVVSDPLGETAFRTFTVTVTANDPPRFNGVRNFDIRVGEPLVKTLEAIDPDSDDPLVFTLSEGPLHASLDRDGRLFWVPTEAQLGTHVFVAVVSDRGGLTDEATFQVNVNPAGLGPDLLPIADRTVRPGVQTTFRLQVSNPRPDTNLLFEVDSGAPIVGVDTIGGRVDINPTRADLGRHDVVITVSNTFGSDTEHFILTVADPNAAPNATSDRVLAPLGQTTTVTAPGVLINDTDPDGDTLTATLVTPPALGSVELRPDGSFDYRPGAPPDEPLSAIPAYAFRGFEVATIYRDWRPFKGVVAGDLDGDGTIELVGVGHRSTGFGNFGWLVAFRANKATQAFDLVWANHTWANNDPVGYDELASGSPLLLADLDGDGPLEIIAQSYCANALVVFEHTGAPRFTQGAQGCAAALKTYKMTAADLDQDGRAEILRIVDRTIPGDLADLQAFDGEGTLLWSSPLSGTPSEDGSDIVAADLDLDGHLEIVTRRHAFASDGTPLWAAPQFGTDSSTSLSAVVNLNDDPFGEAVFYSSQRGMEARTHDGDCLWRARHAPLNAADDCPLRLVANMNLGYGLIATDLDGDDRPELVLVSGGPNNALSSKVTALRHDGTLLWQWQPVVADVLFNANDVAAFDFDGDGSMEVVVSGFPDSSAAVAGVVFLDGRTGTPRLTLPANDQIPGGNGTGQGAVIDLIELMVLDVDGDRTAELVIANEGYWGEGRAHGVVALQSGGTPWMPTRPSWPQHTYAVTNATPSGSLPARPAINWLTPGLNNFRVNVPLPDEVGGSDTFTYTASDGELTSNTATVHLELRRPNDPPVFLGRPKTVVGAGLTYNERLFVTDPDPGDTITLSLNRGPTGLTLDDATLVWPTTELDLGEHTILVSARDSEGAITTLAFTLRVVSPSPVPDVTGLTRDAAEDALDAADFALGRLTSRFDPTTPAGLVLDQTPVAGTLAAPGDLVALTLSLGPAPGDQDNDLDTFTPHRGDCDDTNNTIHPGAPDPTDGVDQDCDGKDGSETPVSIAIEPETADILTFESLDFRAFGVFSDGSAQELTHAATWSVANLGGASITNARFTSTAPGSATLTATFRGITHSVPLTVHARTPSDTPPVAFFTRPNEGATLTAPTPIVGTVSDPTLIRWELDLAETGTTTFTRLATGTDPIALSTLATLDTTTLVNGAYDLRLTAINAAGLKTSDTLTLVVDGDMKVGLFSLAFEDMRVELSALPITATRTYDSRDKRVGDFGVGWSLALSSVALRCSPNLGEGWFSAKSGLAFVLLGERAHTCSVTLPGGAVETFELSPTPSTSVLVPFITATARFNPRGRARGVLAVESNSFLLITDAQPGPVTLLDDTTFGTFAPTRFRYTAADGSVFRFEDGALKSVTDRGGKRLTLTGTEISSSSGLGELPVVVRLVRDALGRITSITAPDGATARYAYNQSGDLVAHTDPMGHTTRFFYDRHHGLIRIEDPLGRPVVRSEYDERGRLIATTDALGQRTSYTHDDENRTLTTTFPDGSIRVVSYDASGLVTSRVAGVTIDGELVPVEEQLSYDAAGNVTRRVDPDGLVTESTFAGEHFTERIIDPGGLNLVERQQVIGDRILSQTDAAQRTTTFGYDSRGLTNLAVLPGGATIRVLRDAAGRVNRIIEPTGERRDLAFGTAWAACGEKLIDRNGLDSLIVRCELDLVGRPTMVSRIAFENGWTSSLERTRTWEYDAAGRVTRTTDPEDHETLFTYDAAGQLLTIVEPSGTTTMTYDDAGRLVTRTKKDGGLERFAYDYAGRLTSHTDPDGVVTTHTYDELGRHIETREGGELVVAYTLTPGGRVAAVRTPDGVTEHTYDGAGRIVETRLPPVMTPDGETQRPTFTYELDPSGRELAVNDPNGLRTETHYDAAGRPVRKVLPDSSELTFTYDAAGRLLTSTDESGALTTRTYDALGRLSQIEEPEVDGVRPTTRLFHDAFGDLRQRIDALGKTTTFTYDGLGRELFRARPDGAVRRREYDTRGYLARQFDYDGTAVVHTHDAMGRLVARTSGALSETFTFSPGGRLTGFADPRGATTFEYDPRGRVIAQVDPDGVELGYGYDAAGRVALLDVQGDLTRYTYDAAGRLTRVVTPEGTFDYRLDLGGRIDSMTLPNGVTTHMTWDTRNRPLDVVHQRGATELARFSSTFSARGQRLSASDGSSTETFGYDPLGRLTAVTRAGVSPYTATFAYDAVGNRTAMTVDGITTSYTYGVNHELLSASTAAETTTFSYDGRGNRTRETSPDGTRNYTWDALNRLVGVDDGALTTWGYAPDGQRVRRTSGATTEHLLVDRQNTSGFAQVVASHAPDGELKTAWRFGHDGLAQVGANTRFYGTDGGGHVRALTDTSGAITDRYDYLPHGAIHTRTGTSDNPRLARGERFDTGFYDLRARPYDPTTGLFATRDPFDGFIDRPYSHQPYQYADGDPVGSRDPLGLFTLPELSFSMNLESGLKGINLGSSKAAFCSADATLTALQYMVRAIDIAIWFWNIKDNGAALKTRHLKAEFDLPKESKLAVQVSPFIKDGSLGAEIGLEFQKGHNKGGLAVKWHKGKWEPAIASGAFMFELGICGWSVAQAGPVLEHDFGTGKGSFSLAVEMAKDEDDHFESGGFKWKLLEWD